MEFHSAQTGIEVLRAKTGSQQLSLLQDASSTSPIHHALIRVDTTQSPARVAYYIDGRLVDSYKKQNVDLATLSRSFRIEAAGAGNARWIIDNIQFHSGPSRSNGLLCSKPRPDELWERAGDPTASASFVSGPGTAPAGSGSAKLTVDATGGEILYNLLMADAASIKSAHSDTATYRTTVGVQAIICSLTGNDDVTRRHQLI